MEARKRIDDLLEGEEKAAGRISEMHKRVEGLKTLEDDYLRSASCISGVITLRSLSFSAVSSSQRAL